MARKVKPVIAIQAQIEAGTPAMKARSGIEPDNKGEEGQDGCLARRAADRRETVLLGHHVLDPALVLGVITSTALSSPSPLKP